jgi:hypothetical protein
MKRPARPARLSPRLLLGPLCLLGLLLLPLPVFGRQAPGAEPATGAETGRESVLTDAQGLRLAQRLLGEGRPQEAEGLYALLARSLIPEIRVESLFQLGRFALARKEYNKAAECFLTILNSFPDLVRVRLELARAYFLNENYEDARFQFELVKGGRELPPAVLANVDHFLDLIRRQKNWSLSFGLNLVPDSNLNQAGGERNECIATIFGLLCRELEEKERALGARLNASADHYLRFNGRFGLRSSLGAYLTDFPESRYDDHILHAASGPRYVWESGEASLQPSFTRRRVGGKAYSDAYGLQLDLQKGFERLFLGLGGGLAWNRYHNGQVDDLLRGRNLRLSLRPRWILTSRSFIQAGLSLERDETANLIYAGDSLGGSLGGYHIFPYGFSLFAEVSLTGARYRKEQYYITREYYFDAERRRDRIYALYAALSWHRFEHLGFTPILQYNYVRRDSNIWSYAYDRHRLNLACDFRF